MNNNKKVKSNYVIAKLMDRNGTLVCCRSKQEMKSQNQHTLVRDEDELAYRI